MLPVDQEIVILLDTSLLGRKRMLARQVMDTILDTLSENDDVTITSLNGEALHGCFNGTLKMLQVSALTRFFLSFEYRVILVGNPRTHYFTKRLVEYFR